LQETVTKERNWFLEQKNTCTQTTTTVGLLKNWRKDSSFKLYWFQVITSVFFRETKNSRNVLQPALGNASACP